MIQKRAALWSAEEYTYPVIGNFVPFIMTYIHDEDDTWAYDGLKAYYCMDQMLEIFQYMVDNGQPLPEPYNAAGPVPKGTDVKQMFGIMIEQNPQKVGEPDPAIAKWPDLADEWLKKQRAGKN